MHADMMYRNETAFTFIMLELHWPAIIFETMIASACKISLLTLQSSLEKPTAKSNSVKPNLPFHNEEEMMLERNQLWCIALQVLLPSHK